MDETCVASIVAVVRLTMGVGVAAQETYLRVEIEQNHLRLITSGGRRIVPERETDRQRTPDPLSGTSNTQTLALRFAGFLISGIMRMNRRAWLPPLAATTATYCLPPTA